MMLKKESLEVRKSRIARDSYAMGQQYARAELSKSKFGARLVKHVGHETGAPMNELLR